MSAQSTDSGPDRGAGEPGGPTPLATEAIVTPPRDALQLQILATEHWSLLASRALAWNESFSRAGMFLATLSGATVALALAAQASNFGRTFQLFALAVLPVVLYVGITTVVRLTESDYHDFQCVLGMNRIRSAYLDRAPELQPYFVMGTHDDLASISITQGYRSGRPALSHVLSATPAVVVTITSVVAAALGAILGHDVAQVPGAIIGGVAAFAVAFSGLMLYARRVFRLILAAHTPRFPTPAPTSAPGQPGPPMTRHVPPGSRRGD
jgi:hypothetical protein